MYYRKENIMEDSRALKPKSLRIDDETAQKFKEIANSIGQNQQETMQLLINTYHMQQKKTGLSEHKASLEQFESYATSLISMYTQSLQANHDLRETVLQEMDATLKSKDSVIQDLQEKMAAAKQKKEDAEAQATVYSNENKALDKENTRLQSALADKESLNIALNDSCSHLKAKCEAMEVDAGQSEALREQLDHIKAEHEKALREQADLQKQLQQEQEAHTDAMEQIQAKAQLKQYKALLEAEKAHQQEIQSLKAQTQAEIDTYQQKYFDLLQQLQGKDAIRQK